MAVKRLDLSEVAPILHAPMPSAEPKKPAEPAGPAIADLLGVAAGDAVGRRAYFDTEMSATSSPDAPTLILAGATVMDYRTPDGRHTHAFRMTLPPSTARRIARACGGHAPTSMPAALIALAELGLATLAERGQCLTVRSAPDPLATQRRAARAGGFVKRYDRKTA